MVWYKFVHSTFKLKMLEIERKRLFACLISIYLNNENNDLCVFLKKEA